MKNSCSWDFFLERGSWPRQEVRVCSTLFPAQLSRIWTEKAWKAWRVKVKWENVSIVKVRPSQESSTPQGDSQRPVGAQSDIWINQNTGPSFMPMATCASATNSLRQEKPGSLKSRRKRSHHFPLSPKLICFIWPWKMLGASHEEIVYGIHPHWWCLEKHPFAFQKDVRCPKCYVLQYT